MSVPRLFIAGLGNLPYPNTRHSIGHLIIDALASRLGITLQKRGRGISGEGYVTIGRTPMSITLFKSQQLMNISGRSVVEACRQGGFPPAALLVVADSLSHKPMKLSARMGGSANGHNGIKSVISAFGNNQEFWRLRVGIGREDQGDPSDYVLGRLPVNEIGFWKREGLDLVLKEIEKIGQEQQRP